MGSRGACRLRVVPVAASLLLAGCASYQLEPLSASHPANPEAPVAAARPRSLTLAYAPSDVPSAWPAPAGASASGRGATTGAAPLVTGEGEVLATVPQAG